MNERSGSDPTRDTFAVLVAARPQPPAELTSPDTPDAEHLFRRIVESPRGRTARTNGRRPLTLAVSVAAAAAVVGILLTVPGRQGPSSVGSADTSAPAPTPAETEVPTPTAAPAISPTVPSESVGSADTTRATITVDSRDAMMSGHHEYALAGENLSWRYQTDMADGTHPIVEDRIVDGVMYHLFPPFAGEPAHWEFFEEVPQYPGVPTPSTPHELFEALGGATAFDDQGPEDVEGFATTRFVATSLDVVSLADLPIGGIVTWPGVTLTNLELWVDADGVTHRVVAALDTESLEGEPATTTVTVEFFDIGEPMTIGAPPGAVEGHAVG